MNKELVLNRLQAIELERRELESLLLKEKESVVFPIYTKKDCVFSKHISPNSAIDVRIESGWTQLQSTEWGRTILTESWKYYMRGEAELITSDEFIDAFRAAFEKLDNL